MQVSKFLIQYNALKHTNVTAFCKNASDGHSIKTAEKMMAVFAN